MKINNILITGHPGVGKTTLFMKLAERLEQYRPIGFYTEEIREKGIRKGFRLIDLDGRELTLSHVNFRGKFRVGKYGVDIDSFEAYLARAELGGSTSELMMIDEIGKMECLSSRFRKIVLDRLDSEKSLIATIALKGTGIISDIKRRDDVILFEISISNRDKLANEILHCLPFNK